MAPGIALASAGIVAVLSFVVSGAGYRSMVRTGNASVGYIAVAFALLGAKNVAKLGLLLREGTVPFAWEIAFSVADIAVLVLVAWPLLRRLAA